MIVGAVVTAFFVGFLAGLLAFKVKQRWCPDCGRVMLPGGERQAALMSTDVREDRG